MFPLNDNNAVSKFAFWTLAFILVNSFIFYLELTAPNPDNFIAQFALVPDSVNFLRIGTLFPFLSSQFLHGGFFHIVSNMLFLWVFGRNVEAAFGHLSFPVFFLLSGTVAGLTQYLFMPTDTTPMLGASGAVAGVLGAYLALFPGNKIKTLLFIFIYVTIIDIPAYILLFYWFITQLFSGVAAISLNQASGGIAFLPHIGGFLFGFLTAVFTLPRRNYLRLKFS